MMLYYFLHSTCEKNCVWTLTTKLVEKNYQKNVYWYATCATICNRTCITKTVENRENATTSFPDGFNSFYYWFGDKKKEIGAWTTDLSKMVRIRERKIPEILDCYFCLEYL